MGILEAFIALVGYEVSSAINELFKNIQLLVQFIIFGYDLTKLTDRKRLFTALHVGFIC